MPKMPTGGRTPLGRQINYVEDMSSPSRLLQSPPKKLGRIVEIRKPQGEPSYEVKLKWVSGSSAGSKSNWIPLEEPPEFFSVIYGSPEKLVEQNYYCRVTYSGGSTSRGFARITRPVSQDRLEIGTWNRINQEGKSFCMPGSGLI